MRKVSTIIMALAVIMGMTQCTKPAMQLYDGSYTGVTKEITFSTGGSSKVEIENVLNELKFKWQTGDTLYVYGSANGLFTDGQYCGKLGIVRGMGTENGFFSGTLNNVPETGMLRFYYCPKELFDKEQETITVDLSTQDGSLEDVASHLVACADVTVKPDGGDYSATLAVPYSVVKFDLSAFGTTDITMTGTTNSGLTISEKGVKGVTAGTSTTLSGVTSVSTSYYVAVMPESVTTLNFSGNGLVGSKTVTLTENTFETLNGGGGGVPVPAAEPVEGDDWINFNDPAMGVEGLPIWSKKNIGATNGATAETWYGDFYAWGATTTYYVEGTGHSDPPTWKTSPKDYSGGYIRENCPYVIDFWAYEFSKYTGNDGKNTLDAADDVAIVVMGGDWRMPIGGSWGVGEWQQLERNTYWKWEYGYMGIEGLNGFVIYKVKDVADKGLYQYDSNNNPDNPNWVTENHLSYLLPKIVQGNYTTSDPHMFLPAAGDFYTTRRDAGNYCYYWSSSLVNNDNSMAYLCTYPDQGQPHIRAYRNFGFSVRPVR